MQDLFVEIKNFAQTKKKFALKTGDCLKRFRLKSLMSLELWQHCES